MVRLLVSVLVVVVAGVVVNLEEVGVANAAVVRAFLIAVNVEVSITFAADIVV